jgi:hypothetical protein
MNLTIGQYGKEEGAFIPIPVPFSMETLWNSLDNMARAEARHLYTNPNERIT